MLCEEKLEVFENGFEDGRFKLRIEFYGKDARRLLLAIIRELYLPDYGGEGYVYPFECAREFWGGIYMDAAEIKAGEFTPSPPVKFLNRSIVNRLKKALEEINAPREVKESIDIEKAEVHRLKGGVCWPSEGTSSSTRGGRSS